MMLSSSGKNQITRQKKIEINNSTSNSEVQHDSDVQLNEFKSLNLNEENISNSDNDCEINKVNGVNHRLNLSLDHDHLETANMFKFPSNNNINNIIKVETSPSSSSSSSSPSNLAVSTSSYLQIENNLASHNKLSLSACNVPSASSSQSSLTNITASNSNINTASLTAILNKSTNNGNKIRISNNLKQRLTKAATGPSNTSSNKTLNAPNNTSTNHSSKTRRLGNLMGFSMGSFFSKSMTSEEMANYNENENEILGDSSTKIMNTNDTENNNSTSNENESKPTVRLPKQRDGSANRQKNLAKSFLALSVFARAGYNSKLKKNSESSSSNSSSVASSKNTLHDSETIAGSNNLSSSVSPPTNMRNVSLMLMKNSANSKSTEIRKKIGSFEVDLEKLAKELILPSIDAPLTSFYKEDSLDKPPLVSSKTVDSTSSNSPSSPSSNHKNSAKNMLLRSMTNNK